MIRVHKPAEPPEPLRGAGVRAVTALADALARDPHAPLRFDPLYGAPTVKRALLNAQHGKCAFCESKIEATGHGDVEHFRPKAAVRQKSSAPAQVPGYWWLAYDWDNLLASCARCNQSHKRELFPLVNPGARARGPTEDLRLERPLLIHPGAEDPSFHLSFHSETPRAVSARGQASLEVLGLRRGALTEARRARLESLRALLGTLLLQGEGAPDLHKRALRWVLDAVDDRAEFAAMSRAWLHHNPLPLQSLLPLADAPAPHAGAALLAQTLLSATTLVAGARRFRPIEVEFYGQGAVFFDPFAHAHPLQRQAGRWYFHRAGPAGGYRGGSYAGLDLACGSADFAAGMLLRSLRDEEGRTICGPALCVRALLQAAGAPSVAALDARLGSVFAGPLRLEAAEPDPAPILRTPRVGLTLKKTDHADARWRFVAAPWRFVTDQRLPKGRAHTALALLAAGCAPDAVAARTGAAADRLAAALAEGRGLGYADFVGLSPSGLTLARLCGAAWNSDVPRSGA